MMMVPGVETAHSREVWQDPRYPVFGPLDVVAGNDTVVIHYTGADDLIDGDPGEHASELPQYHRNMQYSYVTRRGYSLGYLFSVDWLGGVWQIRGWEFQSAANKGHNDHTYPILVLVDGQDRCTPEAARSIRMLIREAERRSGRQLLVTGHGLLPGAATPCPGLGLRQDIAEGVFDVRKHDDNDSDEDEDEMPVTADLIVPPVERVGKPWLVVVDGDVRPATSFDVINTKLTVRNLVDEYRVEQYDALHKAVYGE